jgi:hypothetical protein
VIFRAAVLVLCLAAPLAARDPTANDSGTDAQIQVAIAKARATLPLFLANAVDA